MIIVYLALTAALAALSLGVLVRSFLYGTALLNSIALIELFWLVVSLGALWLLPLSPSATFVAQYLTIATTSMVVAYALWSNRQLEVDHDLYPRWYRYCAFFHNLILLALAAQALQANCSSGCTLDLQEHYGTLVPATLVLGVLLLAAQLGGNSIERQEANDWHRQALDAILEHPTCEATFGDITDIYFMAEESVWYTQRNVLAYWIEGNKASGHLVGRFVSKGDKEHLRDGHIQLDCGKAITIARDEADA